MKSKSNETVSATKNNFFSFPERINNIAIFLIVILYTILCVVITALIARPNDYVIIPESNHITEYNQDANLSIKVANGITYSESESKFVQRYTTYGYLKTNNHNTLTSSVAKLSGLTNSKTMKYYTEQSSSNVSSTTIYFSSSQAVAGDGFEELFAEYKYQVKTNNASLQEDKVVKFSEKMIKLSPREIKSTQYTNKNNYSGLFSFTISQATTTSETDHSLQTVIKVDTKLKDYHLDYQSFLVTNTGDIYNLVGYYNVATDSTYTYTHTNNFVKRLNVEYVVVKAYIYVGDTVTEALYRVKLADLLTK